MNPQSFLPVVKQDGSIAGLFAIPSTTFAGTETEFSLAAFSALAESNQSSESTLYTGSLIGAAQTIPGSGRALSKATFYLKKTGAPTGNAVAKIYALSGSHGTTGIPTGAALATSATFNVATLTTSYALVDFLFTGANRVTLASGTNYALTIEYSGGGVSDNIQVGYDGTSPTHAGNYATLTGAVWTADATKDACFYAYTDAVVVKKFTPGAPIVQELPRQTEFMGAYFNHTDEVNQAYASYSSFIPLNDILPYRSWQNATIPGARTEGTLGVMVDALIYGRSAAITVSVPAAPTVTTPAALTWTVNAKFSTMAMSSFFDVNWVALFQASFPTLEPASIVLLTNPAGNELKAFVVNAGQPQAESINYNTLRIVKVVRQNIATGLRAFTFRIYDTYGHETDVTLNVTVA